MNKPSIRINFKEMTVESRHSNVVINYTMEDLMRLNQIYERLCTAEYLFENQSADKPITMEEAYIMADFIREKIDDVCTCESEMITTWYAEAYKFAKWGEEEEDE